MAPALLLTLLVAMCSGDEATDGSPISSTIQQSAGVLNGYKVPGHPADAKAAGFDRCEVYNEAMTCRRLGARFLGFPSESAAVTIEKTGEPSAYPKTGPLMYQTIEFTYPPIRIEYGGKNENYQETGRFGPLAEIERRIQNEGWVHRETRHGRSYYSEESPIEINVNAKGTLTLTFLEEGAAGEILRIRTEAAEIAKKRAAERKMLEAMR